MREQSVEPLELEKMFLTKILIEFYNHKLVLREEKYEYKFGYNHADTIKEIRYFNNLIKRT